jgi:hypothetical protein
MSLPTSVQALSLCKAMYTTHFCNRARAGFSTSAHDDKVTSARQGTLLHPVTMSGTVNRPSMRGLLCIECSSLQGGIKQKCYVLSHLVDYTRMGEIGDCRIQTRQSMCMLNRKIPSMVDWNLKATSQHCFPEILLCRKTTMDQIQCIVDSSIFVNESRKVENSSYPAQPSYY